MSNKLPYNPIVFKNGTPPEPNPDNGAIAPENLWSVIERAQVWTGFRILGIDAQGLTSPVEPYYESTAHVVADIVDEADKRRVSGERFTDKRNILSLAAFLAVETTDTTQLLGDFEGMTIDIGSGNGQLGKDLAPRPGAHVIDLDISLEALKSSAGATKILADGTKIPLPDGAVDNAVSMFSTSVHTTTIEARLRGITEMLRVSKQGGRAFMIPLYADMVLRQERWHKLEQMSKTDPYLNNYRDILRREAAIDYAQTALLRSLMSTDHVEITPVLTQVINDQGEVRDCISAVFDIKKPLTEDVVNRTIRLSAARFVTKKA